MKINCFARPPKFLNRMIMMMLGVLIQGFGLSLLIQIDLGVDPWTSVMLGISSHTGFAFGHCQVIVAAFLFIFVFIFDNSKIGFATVGNMVFCGYVADFFCWIWDMLLPGFFKTPVVAWVSLLPIIVIFITGVSAYLCADLGGAPYDVIPFIVTDRIKKVPFRIVRMSWDILFVILGFILGGPIGVVTILFAAGLGPAIAWFQKKLKRFIS